MKRNKIAKMLKGLLTFTAITAVALTGLTLTAPPAEAVIVKRIAGNDRFETASKISHSGFSTTRTRTVVIANGLSFPDSVSATPLAGKLKAPLLTVQPNRVPVSIEREIARIKPSTIIIVGGTGVVNSAVERKLRSINGAQTLRLSGSDRYETSIAVMKYGWPEGSATAFIASGASFPDALAAGPAAIRHGLPVMLTHSSVVGKTKAALKGTTHVRVAGGTGVLTDSVVNRVAPTAKVTRYAGSDRYETATKIAQGMFSDSKGIYVSSGLTFADALPGAVLAGAKQTPLILTQKTCAPAATVAYIKSKKPSSIVAFGGSAVVNNQAASGQACPKPKPKPAPVKLPNPSYTITPAGFGHQAEIDRCIGPIRVSTLERYFGKAYIAEHWSCGGSRFPKAKNTVIRVNGLGLYRSAGVVATVNANDPNAATRIPRGYDAYYQTCLNGDWSRTIIIGLKKLG